MANVNAELVGEDSVRNLLTELPKRVKKKALRAAVTAGSTPINRAAKAKAPRASGMLKKAMTRKIKMYRGAAVAIIGARKDLSAVVTRALKKGNVALANIATRAVPANYLHLVQSGTMPHTVNGRQHPGTAANPFLDQAYHQNKSAAEAAAAAKMREVVEREARELGESVMGLEAGIRTAIAGDAIAVIVGTRIRPIEQGPDDERPYLVYKVTDRGVNDTLADGPADYRPIEFEVGIYADDFDQGADLAGLLFERLCDYGATAGGVELDTTFDGESDVEEVIPEGGTLPVFVRVMTFRGLYKLAA